MTCMLAIKIEREKYKHFKVPREVYVYVRQLEYGIRKKESREALRKMYPNRFPMED